MGIDAASLSHRITIERRVNSQDPETGAVTPSWVPVVRDLAASIEPMSVREFLSAQSMQSEVSTRIVIRYREGLDASMRIREGKTIYVPAGFLADKTSGIEYLTIPCSIGVAQE